MTQLEKAQKIVKEAEDEYGSGHCCYAFSNLLSIIDDLENELEEIKWKGEGRD